MLFRSNDTATTEIYTMVDTLSLHDALPIWWAYAASLLLITAGLFFGRNRTASGLSATQPE